MRVVIISKTFVADTAQRQLEWLARQPGLDVALITPHAWRADDGRHVPFQPRFTTGYEVRQTPIVFNGRYHLYLYRGLGMLLHALRPDLIHIDEEPYNPAAFQAQWLARRMGRPTVLMAWQNIARAYPIPYPWLERYNYRHTAHIITGNAAAASVLRRKGYLGPLSVFSVHGIDPDLYAPVFHERAASKFTIGYVGRLVEYKGLGLLIEALASLPEWCHLRVVGSGPDAEALRRLAVTCGVAARVEWLPAVAASDVPATLGALDALALPSLTRPNWMEQFGRVLIEAMACGVPVIGSDSGEIPRVIGEAGLIVPEGDVAALRQALWRLAEHPELRQRLAEAGRARVLAQFTQEQVASQLASVYADVLHSGKSRAGMKKEALDAHERVAGERSN